MFRRALCLLALAGLAWAPPALAWGEYGHRTVAAIAEANVTPLTRARIRVLLRSAPGLGTPDCKVRTIEDASYWPDCVRRDAWRFSYTFSWHYQTEPVCKPYDAKANCAGGNCITAQIERNRRILADKSLPGPVRLEALIFLVHFVGDIHMPLHSGDNGDQGGNAVKAQYGIAPGFNLHAIWDGPEAERAISEATPGLVRRYSAAERAELGGGTPADWGRESWEFAREIYRKAMGKDPCDGQANPTEIVWSESAIESSVPLAQKRIEQGGLRLAAMLDAALGK